MYFPADISTQVFQYVWSWVIDTSLGLYVFQLRAAVLPFENEFVSRTQTGISLRVKILLNRGDTRQ